MEIWLIAKRQSETYGHGSFGEGWKLPTQGPWDSGDPHPAFTTETAALAYIQAGRIFGAEPLRIELKTDPDEHDPA